jgi:hypothetical protein
VGGLAPQAPATVGGASCDAAALQGEMPRASDLNSPLMSTTADILDRGQKEGLFRAGIDPMQLYITLAGCAYFYLSTIHTLSVGFRRDLGTPKILAQRMVHIIDMITAYILR